MNIVFYNQNFSQHLEIWQDYERKHIKSSVKVFMIKKIVCSNFFHYEPNFVIFLMDILDL